jgi:hypothetical protein
MVSEVSVNGEFENGYRNFKGINFKDYDEDLGPIIRMVSNEQLTYLVFDAGVSAIEVNERVAVSNAETANVYLDSAAALPPKSSNVFSTMGTQDFHSVVATEQAVVGVDRSINKVWLISRTKGAAAISEYRVSTLLMDAFDKTGNTAKLVTTYNKKSKTISISFISYDQSVSTSIVYDTSNDLWYGSSDIIKYYDTNIDDYMLSLLLYGGYYYLTEEIEPNHTSMVDPVSAFGYTEIGNVIIPQRSYIEFVVKEDALARVMLKNMTINGLGIPTKIELQPESSMQYLIGPTSSSASGKHSEHIGIYTARYIPQPAPLVFKSNYTFRINVTTPSIRPLEIGDLIEITYQSSSGTKTEPYIISMVISSTASAFVYAVDRKIDYVSTDATFFYGWRVPMRASIGTNRGGKTVINVPTKRTANLLMGAAGDKVNTSRDDNTKPFGKWIRVRMWFDGIDPIFIDSVESALTPYY